MSELVLNYQWQEPYLAAVLEMNPQSLKTKIHTAEAAIHKRVIDNNLDSEERQAISDALSSLKVLRNES